MGASYRVAWLSLSMLSLGDSTWLALDGRYGDPSNGTEDSGRWA